MSNRARLVVAVIAILLWTIYAGMTRPQSLDEIFRGFGCPTLTRCAPDVRDVCGVDAWEIRLVQPLSSALATATITVRCGELLESETIRGCLRVSAINTNSDGLVSVEPSLISYGGEGCQPVPEPGVGIMIAIGCLWMAGRGRSVPYKNQPRMGNVV